VAYIGNPPTVGQWRKLDDISGSFNGSTTTFTTSVGGSNVTAGSANQLFVSLGGVIQQPNVDYSVTTNSIIFTTAPGSGLDFFAVLAGDALNAAVPGDGTITTAKLAGNLTVDLDSGSASAPSLTFDPNTGIYSPGEDEVAVSTGGTGRLFVDSTGRVGIGTSSPQSPLTVGATTDFGAIVKISRTDTNFNSGMLVLGNGNSTDNYVGVWRGDANSVTTGGQYLNLGGYDGIVFAAGASALGAQTERMRIDSSGRVGIGTSTPATVVDIEASADAYITIQPGTTDGNVGLLINNSAGTQKGVILYDTDDNYMLLSTENTERMRIDSAGRVGIGTSTVTGFSDYTTVQLGSSSSGSALRLVASGDTPGTDDFVIYKNTSGSYLRSYGDPIVFFGNSSEYGRWDTSGRLLVGTSTSRSAGEVTAQIQLEGTTFDAASLNLISNPGAVAGGVAHITLAKSRSSTIGGTTVVASGDNLGRIQWAGADGTDLDSVAAEIKCEVDATPGANDMPGRLVFSTTADGASSPTERAKITNAGYFKATSTGDYYGGTSGYHESRTGLANNVSHLFSHSASTGAVYGIQITYAQNKGTSTGDQYITCNDSAALRMEVRGNGGIANYSGNNVNLSDRNAKKDISPASDTWDCIKEWEIVNYRYKDQPSDADISLGVIAQQVVMSCPEVVTIFEPAKDAKPAVLDDDGNEVEPAQEAQPEKLGVKEQQMYWMAIKALQEAQVRIEQLEQRLTDAGIA
jgi:hypothetical protein